MDNCKKPIAEILDAILPLLDDCMGSYEIGSENIERCIRVMNRYKWAKEDDAAWNMQMKFINAMENE